jgi:hypothetical protein
VKYICIIYLLGRDVDDRSPQVDFGIVLNAGQDEKNACTGGQVKGRRSKYLTREYELFI